MKKLLIVVAALAAHACSDSTRDGNDTSTAGPETIEEHSGKNISPQLEEQSDTRFSVDTIGDSGEIEAEAGEDLR